MSIRRRGGGRQDSNIRYCSGSESRCECGSRSHVKKLEGGMSDRTGKLVTVVGVKVDVNAMVALAQRRQWVE